MPIIIVLFFCFFYVYVLDPYLCVYIMYWLCMIATIPLATGNKLNCFISTRGMLTIVWHHVCSSVIVLLTVLLFSCCFFVCFCLFLNVNKSSAQKNWNTGLPVWRDRVRCLTIVPVVIRSSPVTGFIFMRCALLFNQHKKLNLLSWLHISIYLFGT